MNNLGPEFSRNRERIRRRVQVSVRALSSGMLAYLHNGQRRSWGLSPAAMFQLQNLVNRRTTDRVWVPLMREPR